ncbi:hypothetical protein BLOT_003025 [Blomia tropicalis]|nr:hypothetical protein BLOT_003025 [Blomia tropicalis]
MQVSFNSSEIVNCQLKDDTTKGIIELFVSSIQRRLYYQDIKPPKPYNTSYLFVVVVMHNSSKSMGTWHPKPECSIIGTLPAECDTCRSVTEFI